MAIEIQGPPIEEDFTVVKEFTDRNKPRKAFWDRYMKMVKEGSTIINFYGAGGVGKSALLKKIEDEIKSRDKITGTEFKYIKYDFSLGTDSLEVLKTFKFQLAAYGCEFPLFDSGSYYYALKVGQNITPLKAKSMMQQIPWIKKINKRLWSADNAIYRVYPFLRVARGFLEVADGIFQATAVPRAITTCFNVVDSLLRYYMESNQFLDKNHESVRNQLNARNQQKDSVALYEYLPTLFAMDVADWIKTTGNKLVVILDNYESLISETNLATTEQLKRDLWLRGRGGLILMIPNTLWTIAGRNKLHWDGALAEETEKHLITALSIKDSNLFLERAGIADKKLREKLVKLTKGYPIFLDLCVDFYAEYKRYHTGEPKISDFGQKREEVIGRIFRYLDKSGDDAAKDMLEFLCVLNIWTDEFAFDIGGKALPNFSNNTYRRVKNFSFIQSEHIQNDDIDLIVYRFDESIQNIFIETCDKFVINKIQIAVDQYFQKNFADKKIFDARAIFYLRLWSEFTARFAEDADELLNRYKKIFADKVSNFISNANFDAAEKILKPFISRFDDSNNLPCTYFEMDLGWLRRAQGKYSEAYVLIDSAYKKRARLLGDEHIETVRSMHKLAIALRDLGRYDDAATLQEKVLTLRKKISDDEYPDTITAMNNLAVTLSDLGRYDDAAALQEQVLTLRKNFSGDEHPDTIAAMNNLAISLNNLGKHDEAFKLMQVALPLYKKILGDEHIETIAAANNLAIYLNDLDRHAEALNQRKKVLALSKKILGDEHPDTIAAMNNLVISFSALDHYGAAETLQKKVLALYKKILGDEHPNTITAMKNLAIYLNDLEHYDDALTLQEQILNICRKKFGNEHPETIAAMNNLVLTFNFLGRRDDVITLQEEILNVYRKKFGNEHLDTLNAANDLAWTLTTAQRHEEALKIMKDTLPTFKKILGDEHPDTLGSADTLIYALKGLGRYEEAIALQKDTLARCKKKLGDNHPLTVRFKKNLEKLLA